MNTVELIQYEFELRIFEESYPRIEKCLQMVTQNQIWSAPNESTVCSGCLVKHLLGNMQQWLYSGVLNHSFQRNRDAEFVPEPNLTAEDLIKEMHFVKDRVSLALQELSETHLTNQYQIQGFETTGFSAIIHVIEHFSYHTGQITTLTKLASNKETNYYDESDSKLNS